MKITTLLLLTLFTSLAHAKSCFTKTFCSTGEAPRHILCGRGQDCSRAKDLGLQFKADCKVSWWLGDAQMMKDYQVNGSSILISGRNTGDEDVIYLLSDNHESVTLKSNPKYVYSQKACL